MPTLRDELAALLQNGVEHGEAKEGLGMQGTALAHERRRPALVRPQQVALDARRRLEGDLGSGMAVSTERDKLQRAGNMHWE